jgi:hypothetical protein
MVIPLCRSLVLLLLAALGVVALPLSASQSQANLICFDETPYCIAGRMGEFWQQHGGLPVFGLPITAQREEWIEGNAYQVQWFERNRLELHPEHPPPYDVLLGRVGDDLLQQQGREWASFARSEPQPGCRFFAETGHNVCGKIYHYWRAAGLEFDGWGGKIEAENIALFGLPISEARTEYLSNGRSYTVQWFERARFELHPGNSPPYDVQLGLLGSEIYHESLPITADSPLFAPPRASLAQAVDYIVERGSSYPPSDVAIIAGYYWDIAPAVGLDPLLAMAQNIHETDFLRSWWAQRPRRNGAGYGVTGETRTTPPPPGQAHEWAWDEERQIWRKGLSFATWEESVRAHLGRLLAYALPEGAANEAQQSLIDYALALRPLPASYRGAALTLRGLNGRWAYPGETYADKIAYFANAIRAR